MINKNRDLHTKYFEFIINKTLVISALKKPRAKEKQKKSSH